MQKWRDLPILKKSFLLLGIPLVLVWLLVGMVLWQFQSFNRSSEMIMNEYKVTIEFLESLGNENSLLKIIMRPNIQNGVEADYKKAVRRTDEVLEALVARKMRQTEFTTGEQQRLIRSIANSMEHYRKDQERLVNTTDGSEQLHLFLSLKTQYTFIDGYGRSLLNVQLEQGNEIWRNLEQINKKRSLLFFILTVICSLLLILLLSVFVWAILSPLKKMGKAADKITAGDYYTASMLPVKGKDEIGKTARSFNLMQLQIRKTIHALEKQTEMERTLQEQRFSQLQSQINPHFLFNTLNTIAAMSREERAPLTEDLIMRLSNFFRYSLESDENQVPLGRELDLLEDYIELQETRYGERIAMKVVRNAELEKTVVPKFILQPLVENAIIHGFRERDGHVRVHARRKGNLVQIFVSDDGCGFETKLPLEKKQHCSLGILNIAERMKLSHGNLKIRSFSGHGTVARITVPLIYKDW